MAVKSGYKQTEVGVIPADWEIYPLQELTIKSAPITYGVLKPGDYVSNGIPLLQIKDVIYGDIKIDELHRIGTNLDEQYSRTKLTEGDIVISLIGTVGKVASIPMAMTGANLHRNLARIRISPKNSSRFILFYLQSEQVQQAIKLATFGSTQALFNLSDLRSLLVALPPLREQQAIAEALSDVDGLIRALDALIAKKRALKSGAMQELLTGQRRLPGFAGAWEVYRFEEIAYIRKTKIDPRRVSEHPFCVELEHIEQGTGQLNGYTVTTNESSIKSVFNAGDVLFGKLRAYLRKYWIADRDGVCTTEIWPLVTKANVVLASYLFQIIQTDNFIEAASTAYGTHMPRSDWNVVKNYSILLPSVAEQTAIAQILADMDAELAALVQKREKTVALKQGMMQRLLTGQVRLVSGAERAWH